MTATSIPSRLVAGDWFRRLALPGVRLYLTSTALLFVELFFIRWVPANIIYVSFFANLMLMASFLGIGLGILVGGRWNAPRVNPFPLLLFATVKLVSVTQINVHVGSADDLNIGASLHGAADVNILVLPLLTGLVAGTMAALALPLGPLLRAMPPLRAYATDILGSLTGIALFGLLSMLQTGPASWLTVVAVLVSLLGLGTGLKPWSLLTGVAIVAAIFVAGAGTDIWSPYQRITVFESGGDIGIDVNGIPHQQFPTTPGKVAWFYTQIDQWYPGRHFNNVLIVGSGNGNDVAAALRRGDEHVDAVEIDPAILQIGRDMHPDRPYQDPRVTATVADGRAFLRNSSSTYDLIVFGQPDSLTLLSTQSNIRLESFLFTREAFASVRSHLALDGLFVLYNFYWEQWPIQRLGAMLKDTFGITPVVRYYSATGHAAVLADGPLLAATAGRPPGGTVDALDLSNPPILPTDDWPFEYLRTPGIGPYYLVALALILGIATLLVAAAARVRGLSRRSFSPHFFVLGAAFLLLETRSLVTFGLLFGNTWSVNALAFFAILVSVLLSIGIAARIRLRTPTPLYVLLGLSLLLAYVIPPASLLIDPAVLRYVVGSAIAFAPVFFANLCFSYSFRDSPTADMAFASNLLGAVVGGALEYLALITGYQALVLLVAGLYGAAYLLATRRRFLADRLLVAGSSLASGSTALGSAEAGD